MILKSRNNEDRIINQLSPNLFEVYGESSSMRRGGMEEIEFIDYEGGPFINKGQLLLKKYIIVHIEDDFKEDKPNRYLLFVKEND